MKHSGWMALLIGMIVGAGVFGALAAVSGQAPGFAPTGRVACLDVVRIYNEYERQKDLEEEMRAVREAIENEIERRRGQIDSLQVVLDSMREDDPARLQKMQEMLRLQLDYKNWSDLMQAQMAREVAVWTRKTYAEILASAEEIARQEGYDVVLYLSPPTLMSFDPDAIKDQIRARSVVYANPAVDLTARVLERLNAQYRAQPKTQMLQISPTLGP